ncbi:MAG: epoxyqueuosine reductase [Deltaproteobacteria bacterium]|nr:epoxyqueuosine reductase [Deltaproteobacteria bacterium]
MNLTEKVKDFTLGAGADIVGVVSVEHIEDVTPNKQKPLKLLKTGRSIISYGVHMLQGVIKGKDLRLKRYNAVEACGANNEVGFKLAYYLEKMGYESLIVHADVPVDFEENGMMGDLSLRHVAVEAGLGEIGLSTNFVCKEYGPRIYLGAVITSAELLPDKKSDEKLCKGEECNLCLKACPVGAIKENGTKDHKLCLPEAMPFGLKNILHHFNRIMGESDVKKRGDLIYSLDTFNVWQSLLTKLGVFGGCFRCMEVCPIGKEHVQLKEENEDESRDDGKSECARQSC